MSNMRHEFNKLTRMDLTAENAENAESKKGERVIEM
jgi:hypothetical protein